MRDQIQIAYLRHEPSYNKLEVTTNQHSFYLEIVTDITTRKDRLSFETWIFRNHIAMTTVEYE
jgi:hypothetical protein